MFTPSLIVSIVIMCFCVALGVVLTFFAFFHLHPFLLLPALLIVNLFITFFITAIANRNHGITASQARIGALLHLMILVLGLVLGLVFEVVVFVNTAFNTNFILWLKNTRPFWLVTVGTGLLAISTGLALSRIVACNNIRIRLERHLQARRPPRRRTRVQPIQTRKPAIVEAARRHASPDRFRCIQCGTVITGGKGTCPNCGAAQQRCMVCHQFIGQEELYNRCPHCGQLAHRTHLLEWIKIKGICPYCKTKLRRKDIT